MGVGWRSSLRWLVDGAVKINRYPTRIRAIEWTAGEAQQGLARQIVANHAAADNVEPERTASRLRVDGLDGVVGKTALRGVSPVAPRSSA